MKDTGMLARQNLKGNVINWEACPVKSPAESPGPFLENNNMILSPLLSNQARPGSLYLHVASQAGYTGRPRGQRGESFGSSHSGPLLASCLFHVEGGQALISFHDTALS